MTMSAATAIQPRYDIVIAGGGMVGASLALLLSRYCGDTCHILVVERFPVAVNENSDHPLYTPSFDARSTALSYGSRCIFEAAGLWTSLSHHVSAIESVHVSQRGRFGSTVLDTSRVDWPALGYVVENQWLGSALMTALQSQGNVTFLSPATLSIMKTNNASRGLVLHIDGEQCECETDLLVVADGAQSALRTSLGIEVSEKAYEQSAIIANVSFRQPHQGRAFERFTDQGPIALLPLCESEAGEPSAALVWNLDPARADRVMAADDATFLALLQQRFGHRLGEFTRVGRRDKFPLMLTTSNEQVRSGVVVMGNAAHALHPVAGQGFNLALRDCDRLAVMVKEAMGANKNPGDLQVLSMYLDKQVADQQVTTAFSDRLPQFFNQQLWPLSLVRNLGLCAMDLLPLVKTPFIQRTAGFFDGAARGMSGEL